MIVLDQHPVVQTQPVVRSPTLGHGIFIQQAKPRQGFARVNDRAGGAGNRLDKAPGQACHTAHMLEKIQHGPLGY